MTTIYHVKLDKVKKQRHTKQHDLRSPTLARLADEISKRADEIMLEKDFATERILTLKDLASIFRKAASTERKLR